MSTFRTRPKRNINCDYGMETTTLDVKNTEMINIFNIKMQNLPRTKNKLQLLYEELKELDSKNPALYTNDDIRRKAEIKTAIENLIYDIHKIENENDELDYLYDTLDIYTDYSKNRFKEPSHVNDSINAVNIVELFRKKQDELKSNPNKVFKNELLEKYDRIVNKEPKNKKKKGFIIHLCKNCGEELSLNLIDGFLTCMKCGLSECIIVDSDKPNYKEPVPDTTAYAYERMNHFIINSIMI